MLIFQKEKLAKRIGAHALRPSNTEMLLTVKSNIINAQVGDLRVPTITDLRVGAITTIMGRRIGHIGTIATVAATNVHGNVTNVDIQRNDAIDGAQCIIIVGTLLITKNME